MRDFPLIRFEHVQKSFGPKKLYTDLCLDIQEGEVFTLLGPSGCGKSVLLKMIIGLIAVDYGAIYVDGCDITRLSEHELVGIRRRVAYLFQGAALFDSLCVGDNVAYALREQFWDTMGEEKIRERVAQSLELVGLSGIEAMWPSDLSGGMRKRVGVARTLALQPSVILYDEPTTGLDPINRSRIGHLIQRIQKQLKITSVVVTHDIEVAFQVSDRLGMLRGGALYQVGSKEEFQQATDSHVRNFVEGRLDEPQTEGSLLL